MPQGDDAAVTSEMRLRLRAAADTDPAAAGARSTIGVDARLRAEAVEGAVGGILVALGLTAWGLVAPWEVDVLRSSEFTLVRVVAGWPSVLVGLGLGLAVPAIALWLTSRAITRRRPWPFGPGRGRLRFAYDWIVVVACMTGMTVPQVAVDWPVAALARGALEIDASGSPPARAARLIAAVAVGLCLYLVARGLLVAIARRLHPDRPAAWIEGGPTSAPKGADATSPVAFSQGEIGPGC